MVIVVLVQREEKIPHTHHHFSFDDNFIMANALTLLISIKCKSGWDSFVVVKLQTLHECDKKKNIAS